MVWKECKIAVGIGIAISKLDFVSVGFEALDITVACLVCWNYSEKNVISHESVDWFSVTVVAVDPHPKLRSGEAFGKLKRGRICINTLGGLGGVGGWEFRGNSQGHQTTAVKYLFGETNIA